MNNTIEDITIALLLATPEDFRAAQKYLEWMKMRRRINDLFYFRAHWLETGRQTRPRYHWVGTR